jgi:hypothetical protein
MLSLNSEQIFTLWKFELVSLPEDEKSLIELAPVVKTSMARLLYVCGKYFSFNLMG